METRFHNLEIVVEVGDLSRAAADAVVNAANDHLWMGGGVAGALKRAGGEAIEREAMAQGPIPVGGAVLTRGGDLPARHVLHAVTMGQDLATSAEIVEKATASSLQLAAERGLGSVAFPALGTGVGGLPHEDCARAMLAAVGRFATEPSSVQVVQFILFDDVAADAFKAVLRESETRERK